MPEALGDGIDFDDFLNIAMSRATRRLQLMFQREVLRPEDLTIQEWRVLLNLARHGGCHLRELSRLASWDASHVGKAALALEKKGLVSRSDDSRDGRRKRLAVTAPGRAAVGRVWPRALALSARVEAGIGKTRYRALKAALAAILALEDEAISGAPATDAPRAGVEEARP